jgi:hypothetical protein
MKYRFSAEIVYNNYQWPLIATAEQRQAIDEAAQAFLDARLKYPVSTLADLYGNMHADLVEAQQKLDAAVDAAFSKKKFSSDTDYVAFLFELYQQILPGMIVAPALLEAAAEGLKRPALRRRWGLPKGSVTRA